MRKESHATQLINAVLQQSHITLFHTSSKKIAIQVVNVLAKWKFQFFDKILHPGQVEQLQQMNFIWHRVQDVSEFPVFTLSQRSNAV